MNGHVQPQRTPTRDERGVRGHLLDELDEAERRELDGVPRVAVLLIEHCSSAELLASRGHGAEVVAVSDPVAQAAARLRAETVTDAARVLLTGSPMRGADLPGQRWRQYQQALLDDHGLLSFAVLPVRTGVDHRAALLLHSRQPDPLAGTPSGLVDLVGGLAGTLVRSLALREQVHHLGLALDSNRHIGVALGILVERLHVTEPEAFVLLQKASQAQSRKLRDVAEDVVLTGELTR